MCFEVKIRELMLLIILLMVQTVTDLINGFVIDMILEHQHATMCDVFEVDTSSSTVVL